LDDDEDIQTVLMTPHDLELAILNGEAVDSKSISSFFLAQRLLNF
jgi:ADP-ribose pyrophosphatase